MSRYKNVLLVEDDVEDSDFFSDVMKEVAPTVCHTLATNGLHGLQMLKASEPNLHDLIFLDLNMPVLDGFEFLVEVKKHPLYKDIPVVVLSTSTTHREKCFELGASLYIAKPASQPLYQTLVKEVLHNDVQKDASLLRERIAAQN